MERDTHACPHLIGPWRLGVSCVTSRVKRLTFDWFSETAKRRNGQTVKRSNGRFTLYRVTSSIRHKTVVLTPSPGVSREGMYLPFSDRNVTMLHAQPLAPTPQIHEKHEKTRSGLDRCQDRHAYGTVITGPACLTNKTLS